MNTKLLIKLAELQIRKSINNMELKKVSYSSDAQFQKIGKDPFKYLNEEIIYDHK